MIKATFNIAQSAVKHKIKKVVYSSSASVYGLAQHFPTPETDNPYDNQTFYGGAKLFGEQLQKEGISHTRTTGYYLDCKPTGNPL